MGKELLRCYIKMLLIQFVFKWFFQVTCWVGMVLLGSILYHPIVLDFSFFLDFFQWPPSCIGIFFLRKIWYVLEVMVVIDNFVLISFSWTSFVPISDRTQNNRGTTINGCSTFFFLTLNRPEKWRCKKKQRQTQKRVASYEVNFFVLKLNDQMCFKA